LQKAQACFDITIPAKILDQLRAFREPQIERFLAPHTIAGQSRTLSYINKIYLIDWRKRFIFVSGLLFPSFNYMKYRYKIKRAFLLPIYYIYRWIGILFDGLAALPKMFKKSDILKIK